MNRLDFVPLESDWLSEHELEFKHRLMFSFPTSRSAQNRDLQERLENATRVDCLFTQVATGDWGDDAVEFSAEPVEFTASSRKAG